MHMKKLIALAALSLAAFSFFSCDSENALSYGLTDICNVVDGQLFTDDGLKYNITEYKAEGKIDTVSRAYISFDLLRKTDGAVSEYDIRLNNFGSVKIKNAIDMSNAGLDDMGVDGVNIFQGWVSGPYLNMQIQYTAKAGSKTRHAYSLVFNDRVDNTDTLHFRLMHNAFGESFDNTDIPSSNIVLVNEMVSFDISKYLAPVGDAVILNFKWDWFKNEGGYLSQEKEAYNEDLLYVKKKAAQN